MQAFLEAPAPPWPWRQRTKPLFAVKPDTVLGRGKDVALRVALTRDPCPALRAMSDCRCRGEGRLK
jgi:hypothetical protein